MKTVAAVVIALSLALSGCGNPMYVGGGMEYVTYGFLNQNTDQSKNVCYRVSIGNIIWSVILSETIIAPIYFVGFDLFNPVRMKKDANDQCN